MEITPLEIQKKEFRKSFRGYKEEDVEDFLERISQSYEKIYKQNIDLKEEVRILKETIQKYEKVETTLKDSLVLAQRTAEDVKQNAQKEQEIIIREAHVKADEIVNEAKHKARVIGNQIEELHRQFTLYKTRFLNFLESQLDFLNSYDMENITPLLNIDCFSKEAATSKDDVDDSKSEIIKGNNFIINNQEVLSGTEIKEETEKDEIKNDEIKNTQMEDESKIE